jgi:hypothetical protein
MSGVSAVPQFDTGRQGGERQASLKFYTKVPSRFAVAKGLKLVVSAEVSDAAGPRRVMCLQSHTTHSGTGQDRRAGA